MKRFTISLLMLPLTIVLFTDEIRAAEGIVVKRDAAERFATLPDGVRFPEGIAANPDNGDIYVGTFDTGGNNKLLRFRKDGELIAQRDFGVTPLLGLEFNPLDNKVYICNFGLSKIQRIAADFNDTTTIEDVGTIPGIGPPPDRTVNNPDGSQDTIGFGSSNFPVPNDLTFNTSGVLFVSDSFQGAIFSINNAHTCATPCPVVTVKHDALLATAGVPPFGANGLALNSDQSKLFISNTGDDRILQLDLISGEITIFAESINGADGVAYHDGRVIVAANQADEIVILNENGRVIAKLGDFRGIGDNGSPRGLLFPASLAIVEDKIFITNLALPLNSVPGDEPEEDVSTYTISRIHIPQKLL